MIGTVLSGRYRLEAKLGIGRHVDGLPGPRHDARPPGRGQGDAPRDVRAGRPARALPPGGARGRQALPPQRRLGDRRGRGRRLPLHRLRVRRRGDAEGADQPGRRARRAGGARLRDRDRPRPHRRPRPQHGPPRHQAAERPDRRRGAGQADRLRHLPPARAGRDDRHRPRPRHHRLRRPRAGDGPRRRPALRHLLARRRPLRDARPARSPSPPTARSGWR